MTDQPEKRTLVGLPSAPIKTVVDHPLHVLEGGEMPRVHFKTLMGLDQIDEVSATAETQFAVQSQINDAMSGAPPPLTSEPQGVLRAPPQPVRTPTALGLPRLGLSLTRTAPAAVKEEGISPQMQTVLAEVMKEVLGKTTPLPSLGKLVQALDARTELDELKKMSGVETAQFARREFNEKILPLINRQLDKVGRTQRTDHSKVLRSAILPSVASPGSTKKQKSGYVVDLPINLQVTPSLSVQVKVWRNSAQYFTPESRVNPDHIPLGDPAQGTVFAEVEPKAVETQSKLSGPLIPQTDIFLDFERPIFAFPGTTNAARGYQTLILSNGSHNSLLGENRKRVETRHDEKFASRVADLNRDQVGDQKAFITDLQPPPDLELALLHPDFVALLKGAAAQAEVPLNALFGFPSWSKEIIKRDALVLLIVTSWLKDVLQKQ